MSLTKKLSKQWCLLKNAIHTQTRTHITHKHSLGVLQGLPKKGRKKKRRLGGLGGTKVVVPAPEQSWVTWLKGDVLFYCSIFFIFSFFYTCTEMAYSKF